MNTAEKIEPTALDMAVQSLREAKAAEQAANQARVEAEANVIQLLGDIPAEGTESTKTAFFKVSVTTKLNRTISDDAALRQALPDEVAKKLLRYKASLDLKALRQLQDNDPQIYAAAARFITTKPAKPTVKYEVL